ncbi:MAG: (2Fe-2S)-binding protein [Eubacterium sp.]|nr:(2Fe-2S)-binding protein [Eubacterium sp.]
MNLDEIVCPCLGTTNQMIKDAVDNGATTLEEVQQETNAGTVCGACLEDIQESINFFLKK